MAEIRIDFFEDVRRDSEAALARFGVTLRAGADFQLALIECFHLQRRLIWPRPRRVIWSKEFRARTLTADQRVAVETIVSELEKGVDVLPRMTKSIRKAGSKDGLLTDRGIHHLHIGATVLPNGFVERNGPLLFVFVAGDSVYLLDLLGHHSFEDDDLIEIIHGNWPHVLASCKPPGIVPGSLSSSFGPEHRKKIRGKFTMGTQTKDGTIYVCPGGGVTTSGHSLIAVRQAKSLLNLVRPAEVWVREHADWIGDQIERLAKIRPSELKMQFLTSLTADTGEANVREAQTNVMFNPVPPLDGAWPMPSLTTIDGAPYPPKSAS